MADQNRVAQLAKFSWQELRPNRNYEVTLEVDPEVIKKHEQVVNAYLDNDFDTDRALKAMTGFKQNASELDEDGVIWHKQLRECLRRLCRRLDKAHTR